MAVPWSSPHGHGGDTLPRHGGGSMAAASPCWISCDDGHSGGIDFSRRGEGREQIQSMVAMAPSSPGERVSDHSPISVSIYTPYLEAIMKTIVKLDFQ
ncbi:unnamed protein product [Miscanthus lutarioriparius]|uniref:Uncharacterized protein n=1 Tax=Miscanthus lutarioriparius TaxID=422564 RepID=A0A811MRX1_9POAL|nr:unnamed protein product [Miscanthus lutarioriparius]